MQQASVCLNAMKNVIEQTKVKLQQYFDIDFILPCNAAFEPPIIKAAEQTLVQAVDTNTPFKGEDLLSDKEIVESI